MIFRNDKCVLRIIDERSDSLRQGLSGPGVHFSSLPGQDRAPLVDSG